MPEQRSEEPHRLKIRKGSEQPFTLRYSREERLSRRGAPQPPGGREGFFRKNRTLIIIFGNVVLLAILAFLFQRGGGFAADRARIGAYSIALQGMVFQEAVYASVTVKNANPPGTAPTAVDRFSVLFSLEPDGQGMLQAAALPPEPGQEVTVGEAIPVKEKAPKTLHAELTIGGTTKRLRRELAK